MSVFSELIKAGYGDLASMYKTVAQETLPSLNDEIAALFWENKFLKLSELNTYNNGTGTKILPIRTRFYGS